MFSPNWINVLIMFAIGIIFCCHPGAALTQDGNEYDLSITPDASTIFQLDPILVRVDVQNRTKQVLRMKSPFSSRFENVSFITKPETVLRYREHTPIHFGISCNDNLAESLRVNETLTTYELLIDTDTQSLTATAGKLNCSARATLGLGKGVLIDSESIEIKINKRDTKELDRLRSALPSMSRWLLMGSHIPVSHYEPMNKALAEIADCNMKKHCLAALLLSQLRTSQSVEQRDKANRALDKFEKTLDPISAEYYLIVRAEVNVAINDLMSAKALLKRVSKNCYDAHVVEEEIKEKMP